MKRLKVLGYMLCVIGSNCAIFNLFFYFFYGTLTNSRNNPIAPCDFQQRKHLEWEFTFLMLVGPCMNMYVHIQKSSRFDSESVP